MAMHIDRRGILTGISGLGLATWLHGQLPEANRTGPPALRPVHRYYDAPNIVHFLTCNPRAETQQRMRPMQYAGIECFIFSEPGRDRAPFDRHRNPKGGFFYEATGSWLMPRGNRRRGSFELTMGYVSTVPGRRFVAFHEWFHPQADRYFYTVDPTGEKAGELGYKYQGVVGYVVPGPNRLIGF
jgi:hypothetical protein